MDLLEATIETTSLENRQLYVKALVPVSKRGCTKEASFVFWIVLKPSKLIPSPFHLNKQVTAELQVSYSAEEQESLPSLKQRKQEVTWRGGGGERFGFLVPGEICQPETSAWVVWRSLTVEGASWARCHILYLISREKSCPELAAQPWRLWVHLTAPPVADPFSPCHSPALLLVLDHHPHSSGSCCVCLAAGKLWHQIWCQRSSNVQLCPLWMSELANSPGVSHMYPSRYQM